MARAAAAAEKTEAQLKNEAHTVASSKLRDAHRDEYNGYVAEAMTARGIEWSPRKTAEEKAAEKLAAILAEYPHLAPQG